MFFIGQNLNHVHITYSFLELLIFFWLNQIDIYCLEIISYHITEILNLEIKTNIFTCFFHEIKTNIFTCFFNINIIIPYEQSFFFHEHIFRSSILHLFVKIGALKYFAIFWIKKRFQQRCFCCEFEFANFLTTALF